MQVSMLLISRWSSLQVGVQVNQHTPLLPHCKPSGHKLMGFSAQSDWGTQTFGTSGKFEYPRHRKPAAQSPSASQTSHIAPSPTQRPSAQTEPSPHCSARTTRRPQVSMDQGSPSVWHWVFQVIQHTPDELHCKPSGHMTDSSSLHVELGTQTMGT